MARRAVDHQERLGGRAAGLAFHNPAHLLEFFHEIALGLQAAGRIDDDDVDVARLRGCDAVVHDRGRVAPIAAADDFDLAALGPYRQLLGSRGAERIGRYEHHAFALRRQGAPELSDGRRLAAAVDADHEDDGRLVIEHEAGIGERQELPHVFLKARDGLVAAVPQLLPRDHPQAVEDLLRGWETEIGREQNLFELIPKFAVEGTFLLRQRFNACKRFTGPSERTAEFCQPAHSEWYPSERPIELLFGVLRHRLPGP